MTTKVPLDVLLAERARRTPKRTFASLEDLLVNPELFGLTTATPLQRAICRIAEGLPLGDLADDPAVKNAIGNLLLLPTTRPKQIVILSGIRVGKSLLAALLAIYWSQTCDVSQLGPGEMPRISILSVDKDKAQVVFDHLSGRIQASPQLAALLIGQPLADSLKLRHPTGLPIEVCVVAGKRSGSSLVSRWSAGCIFDEFPRMDGEGDAVVNWDESVRAVGDRILKGGQIASIGSPWAPHGPAYEVCAQHHGTPSAQLVVIKAPAWDLNPFVWDAAKIADSKLDPDKYQTECLGEFRSPEECLFSMTEVEGSVRKFPDVLAYDPRCSYRAAMDPATRGNGWTFVVTTRVGKLKKVAFVKEWVGSKVKPLSPKTVLSEIASICREYQIKTVDSDQWSSDALRDLAHDEKIHVREINLVEKEKARRYTALKTRFSLGEIEIPPEKNLRSDLLMVTKRTTNNGYKIVLPKSSDGRHCDYMPSLLLAMSSWLEDADEAEELTKEQILTRQAEKLKAMRFAEVKAQSDRQSRLKGQQWRS